MTPIAGFALQVLLHVVNELRPELPQAWRDRLGHDLANAADARVTVRIEEEPSSAPAEEFVTDDPAFGIWRDREDMADVDAYVQRIRAPRFNRDGSRNDSP